MGEVSWGPAARAQWLPGDPRAQIYDEVTAEKPKRSGRPIVGFVYQAILEGQPLGYCAYIGKVMGSTEAAVTQRFHGKQLSAHTSLQSIARDPWKARILSGKNGYRILERVRDTGLGDDENDRAVRRAEAAWIDRLRPEHNRVRPVRPPATEAQPAPARPSGPARPVQRKRRVPAAVVATALVWALASAALGVLEYAAGAPLSPAAVVLPPTLVAVAMWWLVIARKSRRPRRRRR